MDRLRQDDTAEHVTGDQWRPLTKKFFAAHSRARQKKGGVSPPFWTVQEPLLHVDLDLPRLGLFRLCYPDLEDTVFVAGFDAVLLRVLGQGE